MIVRELKKALEQLEREGHSAKQVVVYDACDDLVEPTFNFDDEKLVVIE